MTVRKLATSDKNVGCQVGSQLSEDCWQTSKSLPLEKTQLDSQQYQWITFLDKVKINLL